MAKRRQTKKVMNFKQAAVRRRSKQTARAARAGVDAGRGAARKSADLIERMSNTVQDDVWNSNTDIVSQIAERTMENYARALGFSAEPDQQATEQSVGNAGFGQPSSIVAVGMNAISRELLEQTAEQMGQSLQAMNALVRSRSPQELFALQSDLLKGNLERFVHSSRRISEISMQTALEATRRMSPFSAARR